MAGELNNYSEGAEARAGEEKIFLVAQGQERQEREEDGYPKPQIGGGGTGYSVDEEEIRSTVSTFKFYQLDVLF
ncbi:hypothetical protein CAEBREN_13649 [Caenorhabditis brenneri]|uniref:Uncharacterized protein n=1 Tax=Caenorhabditis brenneri TaxID=135651 RepID=G0MYD0_CAEBE|nr:hypothetical protein CAEBREN_13649 [Caenorhabditis brenneri]